jgi:hypothetical protein
MNGGAPPIPLQAVDLDNLNKRLGQHRLQEALSDLWLDYLASRHKLEAV